MVNKRRLLLGNGASELIDLIARCGTKMGGWKPGMEGCGLQGGGYGVNSLKRFHHTLS